MTRRVVWRGTGWSGSNAVARRVRRGRLTARKFPGRPTKPIFDRPENPSAARGLARPCYRPATTCNLGPAVPGRAPRLSVTGPSRLCGQGGGSAPGRPRAFRGSPDAAPHAPHPLTCGHEQARP